MFLHRGSRGKSQKGDSFLTLRFQINQVVKTDAILRNLFPSRGNVVCVPEMACEHRAEKLVCPRRLGIKEAWLLQNWNLPSTCLKKVKSLNISMAQPYLTLTNFFFRAVMDADGVNETNKGRCNRSQIFRDFL